MTVAEQLRPDEWANIVIAKLTAAISDLPISADDQTRVREMVADTLAELDGTVLPKIKAICDEPLDERKGHGPSRQEQFARIDTLVHAR